MKKILWISNYGYNNSYCLVTKTLLSAFIKDYPGKYDFYILCIGQIYDINVRDFIPELVEKEIGIPASKVTSIRIHTRTFTAPEDAEFITNHNTGIYYLQDLCTKIKPDLIITLNDDTPIAIQKQMADSLGIPLIPYITFDQDTPVGNNPFYKYKFPCVITPAQHSADIFSAKLQVPAHVLPHIVNSKLYFKKGGKASFKTKWTGKNVFTIVAVNRNNIRKRWDLLIKAFEIFAQDKSDVHLFIKTDNLQTEQTFSPINAPQYTFLTTYKHPKVTIVLKEVNDDELNEIYNMADVGFSATSGEGFGLIPCEMSLCHIPQIVPNNSTHPWLFGKDYQGLVKCNKVSAGIGRSFLSIEDIEKDKICIFKTYKHYKSDCVIQKELKPLQPTDDICTLNLAPVNTTGNNIFHDTESLISFIDSNNQAYQRIQILLNTNLAFIKNLDLTRLFEKKWPNRINYVINAEYLKTYTGNSAIGLIDTDDAVRLLNKCYADSEFRNVLGEQCYQSISTRFNREQVTKTMYELLEALTKNN